MISGWKGSPGGEHDNPLQYPCLESPMGRGAWLATVQGVAKSWTRLSDFTFTFTTPSGLPRDSVVKNPPAVQEMQKIRVRSLSQEDPLEESMTTHSSILACRIPWTEESGGLQSIESRSQTRMKQLSTHARRKLTFTQVPTSPTWENPREESQNDHWGEESSN